MKKLHEFFRNCFAEAEKFSGENGVKVSKGIMDIPGLADDKGRSPFEEFPVLESETDENKFRLFFTYEEDISKDIEARQYHGAAQLYQTPWLRAVFPSSNSDNSVFFRIWKERKSLFGTIKQIFNLAPGKKLSSPSELDNFYYLLATGREKEITDKIHISSILDRLEKFDNLKMIRLDSRNFIADIKCERTEHFTKDLIMKYIRELSELRKEFITFD
jgi:hypothetical protein